MVSGGVSLREFIVGGERCSPKKKKDTPHREATPQLIQNRPRHQAIIRLGDLRRRHDIVARARVCASWKRVSLAKRDRRNISARTKYNMRPGIDPAASDAEIHIVDRPVSIRVIQRRPRKPARILAVIDAAELDAARVVRVRGLKVQGEALHFRGGEGGGEGLGWGGRGGGVISVGLILGQGLISEYYRGPWEWSGVGASYIP